MAYGVTSQGFVLKPLDQCLLEVKAAIQATFGANQQVDDPSGPWGELAAILADRESELWDMGQGLYASRDPDQATGAALEGICAITGTLPQAATYSAVACTLSGTAGVVVPAKSVATAGQNGARFASQDDATIGSDGTVSGVVFQAQAAGPVAALAGSLNTIATPVAGWNAILNPLDATLGLAADTDASLRLRRLQELNIAGSATKDAVRAEILRLREKGVTSCSIFRNLTAVVDSNGLPPYSIQALVTGGADTDIWQALWRSVGGGTETYGDQVGTVIDAEGNPQPVAFSRPAILQVYASLALKVDSAWPLDGVAQVTDALVARTLAHLTGGSDVVTRALFPTVLGVSGVRDITSLFVGTAPGPTSEANIVVSDHQIALFDTSRVTVATSPFVP
jgi:uncharacterized phage protein gp47/JayE